MNELLQHTVKSVLKSQELIMAPKGVLSAWPDSSLCRSFPRERVPVAEEPKLGHISKERQRS